MKKVLSLTVALLVLQACAQHSPTNQHAQNPAAANGYLDYST